MNYFLWILALAFSVAGVQSLPTPHYEYHYEHCRKLNFTEVTKDWETGEDLRGFRYDPKTDALQSVTFEKWKGMRQDHKDAMFDECLHEQMRFTAQHMKPKRPFTSPLETRKLVDQKLAEFGRTVTLAIFWGRTRYLEILLPYITRQLRSQGGIADKLFIGLNTAVAADIQLAHSIYREFLGEVEIFKVPQRLHTLVRYNVIWEKLWMDTKHIVVRIDDDLVFMENGVIEQLVLAKLLNPQYSSISANIVNTDKIPALHQYMGAWTPPSKNDTNGIAHLLSEAALAAYKRLPPYQFYGGSYRSPLQALSQHRSIISRFMSRGNIPAEHFRRHVGCVLEAYKFSWFDMSACRCTQAQTGYPQKVPTHAELPDDMANCSPTGAWRWSINLFAVDPREVKLKAISAEEPFFSSHVPTVLKRRTAVLGTAIAVHAMYTPQRRRGVVIGFDEKALLLDDFKLISIKYHQNASSTQG